MEKITKSGENNGLRVGPRFSLLIPFSNAMKNPPFLIEILTAAVLKAEKEIILKNSKQNADYLIKNLRSVVKDLKSVPNEKTLAIFISKSSKKVYFFTPTKKLPIPSVRM